MSKSWPGPTSFGLEQNFVRRSVNDSYPFDTDTFASAIRIDCRSCGGIQRLCGYSRLSSNLGMAAQTYRHSLGKNKELTDASGSRRIRLTNMPVIETVFGTIASLKRNETPHGVVFEFHLRHSTGVRRVRLETVEDRVLREGDTVSVTGVIDANGILIAEAIIQARPVGVTAPPRRKLFYRMLLALAVVFVVIWILLL
jgi:hypothetical protein